ncbi:hypothetical protein [Caballeronia fortuita]|uniref:hypothetical protein n=1 Tax=Caballeronia fortuita TaxID=1777138 RepID=UPI000B202D70|nr:hypothetical protein [Caballeronia fortuita]
MIALRNNDGGRFVIGFSDEDMKPVADGRPADVRAAFDQDAIHAVVTRYASEPFEILVQYPTFDGNIHPVICVPAGVKTAVATRGEINDPGTQKVLLPINSVFVRTLNSSNTVSTAAALWQAWPRLFEICFDNREADVGRLVRRHLGGSGLASSLRFSDKHRFVKNRMHLRSLQAGWMMASQRSNAASARPP